MDRKTKYSNRIFIFPHPCLSQKQTNKKISFGQEISCLQGTPRFIPEFTKACNWNVPASFVSSLADCLTSIEWFRISTNTFYPRRRFENFLLTRKPRYITVLKMQLEFCPPVAILLSAIRFNIILPYTSRLPTISSFTCKFLELKGLVSHAHARYFYSP